MTLFKRTVFAILFGLTGCQEAALRLDEVGADEKETNPSSLGTAEPDAAACAVHVLSLSPAEGAADVAPDAVAVVTFDAPLPPGASWSLTISGVAGHAELSAGASSATFHPEAPLPGSTELEVVASACGDGATARFTTRPDPIDISSLLQTEWSIDVADISWAAPDSAPALLRLFDAPPLRLSLAPAHMPGARTDEVVLLAAVDDGSCAQPVEVGVVDLSQNPVFTVATDDLRAQWNGEATRLLRLAVTGSFDGTSLRDLSFLATVDTRDLAAPMHVDLCAVSEGLGSPCVPCDDGEPACMELAAASAGAAGQPATGCYPP